MRFSNKDIQIVRDLAQQVMDAVRNANPTTTEQYKTG